MSDQSQKPVEFYKLFFSIVATIATAAILYTASSIQQLNINIAVVVERLQQHDRRLQLLEDAQPTAQGGARK